MAQSGAPARRKTRWSPSEARSPVKVRVVVAPALMVEVWKTRGGADGGGMVGLQREVLKLLLASFDAEAFDAQEAASSFVAQRLSWHVRESLKPTAPIHQDELMMRVLTHESGDLRRQAAMGIGRSTILANADACDQPLPNDSAMLNSLISLE